MSLAIPEIEIRQFLSAIESGAIRLTASEEPQRVYAGQVEYTAANGWRLAVFNDCNEWDYVEWIETPDGRRVDYDDLSKSPDLADYRPPSDVAWDRYGIPGNEEFRCIRCGATFEFKRDDVFVCAACRRPTLPALT